MARGWMGARSEFDAGDEDYDLPDVVMFCCLRCGGEVWQPLGAKRVCQCGGQLVANPRRG